MQDLTPSVEYLETLLGRHDDLGPKPDRVTDEYADERIREKIARLPEERQQAGLWSVNRTLKEHEVPAALRLHLVQAVFQLGRIGTETLEARLGRADER